MKELESIIYFYLGSNDILKILQFKKYQKKQNYFNYKFEVLQCT